MLTGLKAAILIAVIIAFGAALLWAATLALIEAVDFIFWLRRVIREARENEKATIE